jgi:hypothetical protein
VGQRERLVAVELTSALPAMLPRSSKPSTNRNTKTFAVARFARAERYAHLQAASQKRAIARFAVALEAHET